MAAKKLSIFFKNVYRLLKISGYCFSTYEFDDYGNVTNFKTIIDAVLVLITAFFTFYTLFFANFEINFEQMLNSKIIHNLANKFGSFSMLVSIILKITQIYLKTYLISLFKNIKFSYEKVRCERYLTYIRIGFLIDFIL